MIYELGVGAFIIFYAFTLKDQLFETSNDNGCPSPRIVKDRLQLKITQTCSPQVSPIDINQDT
jgi:hypothetical protein